MSTNEELPDVQNAAWKNDKKRFGYKFLSKFGWSEEKGLGKNETGITSAVKIKRREDELGLGMEKMTDGAGNKGWNETTNGFNAVLESLKSEYGSKDGDKSSKKAKKDKKKDKNDRKKSANLTVGIKYRKMSEAKSLSNRSSEDLRAILGTGSLSESSDRKRKIEGGDEAEGRSPKKERKEKKEKKAKKDQKKEKKEKSRK